MLEKLMLFCYIPLLYQWRAAVCFADTSVSGFKYIRNGGS